MIKFDPSWESELGSCDPPDEKLQKEAGRRYDRALKDLEGMEGDIEYDDARLAKEFSAACSEVSAAVDDIVATRDEAIARYADAEHAHDEVREIAAHFLDRFKAISISAAKNTTTDIKEVKEWCKVNVEWEAWDVFLHNNRWIIVLYKENDRLHFKMRFG